MDLRFAAIVERLEAIEAIFKQYSASVTAEQERQRELKSSQQLIRAEVHFDDTSKGEQQAETNRQHGTQHSISRAAWYAFGAAVVYAAISYLMLFEMRIQTTQVFHQSEVENIGASHDAANWLNQFKITQEQAKTAQESVKALQQSAAQSAIISSLQTELARIRYGGALIDVTPWMGFYYDKKGGLYVRVKVWNTSGTEATEIKLFGKIEYRDSVPTDYSPSHLTSVSVTPNQLGAFDAAKSIALTTNPNIPNLAPIAIADDIRMLPDALRKRKPTIYAWGLIRYKDFTKQLVDRRFCRKIQTQYIFTDSSGKPIAPDVGNIGTEECQPNKQEPN